MLHTRVRCRARVWDVLDVHEAPDVTTWHLLRDEDTPRLIASPPDRVEPVPVRARATSVRAWARHVLAATLAPSPAWWPARAERLPIAPVPWQFVPAMLVLSGHHRRLLLADEVGMGKTIQAAILLQEIHARAPAACTLAIVPAGLLAQWRDQLRTKVRLDAAVLDADALRREASRPWREIDASRSGGCWLVSIDLMRQSDVVSLLARTPWTLLVVDEAHLAAPGTARLAAVQRVAAASARVLLLSATPATGGPPGLGALRAVGRRAREPPMAVVRRPGTLLTRATRRTRVLNVRLDAAHAAVCARLDRFADRARHECGSAGLLPALVLRRRACSSPAALVRSLERRLDVIGTSCATDADRGPALFDAAGADDDDGEIMRMRAWQDGRSERAELEALLRAARALDPSGRKLEAITRLVGRLTEPAIVFTSYVDTLRALWGRVRGRRVVIVHGSQPDSLRVDAIAAFTAGDADILLTTDASAEGLNLQARCRLVVHADVPPSPRVLEQRTGRVDRYGQLRRVHTVILASATAEDGAALARLARKTQDDDAWLGRATRECRRSGLAARTLTARRPCQVSPGRERPSDGGTADLVTCSLGPGRYRRLAARWRLPADARSLWVGTLTIAGGAPLSSSARPIVLTLGTGQPPTSLAGWRPLVPGVVARAVRLARRMHEWAHDADTAAGDERAHHERDLFGIGEAPAPIATRRHTIWAHARARAVLARRDPSRAGAAS